MKKCLNIRKIFIACCGIVVLLSGCGQISNNKIKEIKEDNSSSINKTTTIKENKTKTETTLNNTEDVDTENSNSKDITIKKQVIYNKNNIKITVVEYKTGDILGDGINFLLENNSKKNITVSCEGLAVNGYMINDLFVSHVSKGKKSNEILYVLKTKLEDAGIEIIGEFEVSFNIYDEDTYENIDSTNLLSIKTNNYDKMKTNPDTKGKKLLDEKGIKIIGKSINTKGLLGPEINLYIENNSKKDVSIRCDKLSINGFMVDSIYSTLVFSGKKAFDQITLLESDLTKNNIDDIKDVELQFSVDDNNTYDKIIETDVIKFSTK